MSGCERGNTSRFCAAKRHRYRAINVSMHWADFRRDYLLKQFHASKLESP